MSRKTEICFLRGNLLAAMMSRIDDVDCSAESIIECLGISKRTLSRWKKAAKKRNRFKRFSVYEALFLAILCSSSKGYFYYLLYCGGRNIEDMEETLIERMPSILKLLSIQYSYEVADALDAILKDAGLELYIPERKKK